MNDWISDYIAAQKAALDSIPVNDVAKIIETLQMAVKEDRQIFIFGRGAFGQCERRFPQLCQRIGMGQKERFKNDRLGREKKRQAR